MPTILAIDDSPISRRIYQITLSPHHNVILVEDAEAALNLLQNQPYDLVISDVNLPGMSGLDLLCAIRSGQSNNNIPFIIVSSDGQGIENAKAQGANLWLLKPVNPRALVNAVNQVIKKQ